MRMMKKIAGLGLVLTAVASGLLVVSARSKAKALREKVAADSLYEVAKKSVARGDYVAAKTALSRLDSRILGNNDAERLSEEVSLLLDENFLYITMRRLHGDSYIGAFDSIRQGRVYHFLHDSILNARFHQRIKSSRSLYEKAGIDEMRAREKADADAMLEELAQCCPSWTLMSKSGYDRPVFKGIYSFSGDLNSDGKSILADVWAAAGVLSKAKSLVLRISFSGKNKYGEEVESKAGPLSVTDLHTVRRYRDSELYASDEVAVFELAAILTTTPSSPYFQYGWR